MVKVSFNNGEDVFCFSDRERAESFIEMVISGDYTHEDQMLTSEYKNHEIEDELALIKEGVGRIKSAGRINTTDFEDICNKLADYGMGFCDAQNVITAAYLHERGLH